MQYIYLRIHRMYVHVCACTTVHHVHLHTHNIHTCTDRCTRTFYTQSPIAINIKAPTKLILIKIKKSFFCDCYQKVLKGQYNKATTHHTLKTPIFILSSQNSPPFSVFCQKNPYTSD